jgi:hypothetical protein
MQQHHTRTHVSELLAAPLLQAATRPEQTQIRKQPTHRRVESIRVAFSTVHTSRSQPHMTQTPKVLKGHTPPDDERRTLATGYAHTAETPTHAHAQGKADAAVRPQDDLSATNAQPAPVLTRNCITATVYCHHRHHRMAPSKSAKASNLLSPAAWHEPHR